MKNRITLILSIFLTFSIFCQTDEPKSILTSKFYSYETLGLVVRFDKGIDSINFPINPKFIKIQNKKLDINGKNSSPKKVYYEYRFTAKIDTTYKLPSAQLWSNNKSYEILLDKYVKLKKTQEPIKLSKVDSIKLADKKEADKIEKYRVAEKERLEDKIKSRISKGINKRVLLLWTDKNILKINDLFKIVIESNMNFDKTSISMEYMENLSQKFNVKSSGFSTIYEDGFEYHYIYFICKALATGEINLKSLDIKIENKKIKTNKWSFKIIN